MGGSEFGAEVLLRSAQKSGKTIEWLLTDRRRPDPQPQRDTGAGIGVA
jgi:hypothetical protein